MLTTEQIEKAQAILLPYGYIVEKTPSSFLVCHDKRKIVKIAYLSGEGAFFIHAASSYWQYDEFKHEAEEALKLIQQLKKAGLPIA